MGLVTKRLGTRSNLLAPSLASAFFGTQRIKARKRPETGARELHRVQRRIGNVGELDPVVVIKLKEYADNP
jgi:hypothetical protein